MQCIVTDEFEFRILYYQRIHRIRHFTKKILFRFTKSLLQDNTGTYAEDILSVQVSLQRCKWRAKVWRAIFHLGNFPLFLVSMALMTLLCFKVTGLSEHS